MEFWDIYDKDKKPTGRTMKRNDWCLKDGEYHLTVLGVVARPDGTFLITKRVMTKAWAPGCWEVSGGAAQAGEESREAVLREVKEETGLDARDADGGYLFTYKRENPGEGDNYFVDVYRFIMDVKDEDLHLQEAEAGVTSLMLDKQFGDAGNTIVIEDFMVGREASVLCFCDGTHIKPMTSAQDHKRAKDGDQGLNTGGMGTFSPSPFYTPEIQKFCEEQIYQPTMDAMKAEGRDFVGILFVGLMMTQDGPKVLEYNARFGDPEAQVVLPRMKNDIIDVMEACIDGKLDQADLQFEDNAAVCVVLASDGYPEHYEKGKKITFLKDFASEDGYYAFHAGTKLTEDGLVTNGGRVLGITAKGATLKEARKNAYKATEWVTFDNKYMRNDIGKAIDEI